jgi:flagellar hook-associated protein 3 FlgL
MEVAYTSTQSLNESNRLNVLKLQRQLLEAQKELSSGRRYDVGESIGSRTAETVSLRQQFARAEVLIETNGVADTRLKASQVTLDDMKAVAQDFISAVLVARDSEGGAGIAKQKAQDSLNSLIDGLNTTIGGQYLFSGTNVTGEPIMRYFMNPPSAAQSAVNAAFLAEFGTVQSDPANNGITPSALQSFLDLGFANLFEPTDWAANWSNASDQNITSRISSQEEVVTSANANEAAFRKLAKAYTMVADLGAENLNDAAFNALSDTATRLAGEAIQDLGVIQARLGASEERIASSNNKLMAQRNVLTTQIENLENVDPFEASTRVTTLMTQLQTAYALTARVQQLTILNYL